MKDNSVKLSGHSKDRFLDRFLAAEPGLDPVVRQRLAARSKSTFTSIRVRKAALAPQRRVPSSEAPPSAPPSESPGPSVASQSEPLAPPAPIPSTLPPPDAVGSASDAEFDPYCIGLVPVFQREGRDGLLARLATVTRLDQLRQMAKVQQIVLPQPLRSGETPADTVRQAIADAVAKRIADRRAAAG